MKIIIYDTLFMKGMIRVEQKTLWKLFEHTGNIQAYLYYKNIEHAISAKVKGDLEGLKKQISLR